MLKLRPTCTSAVIQIYMFCCCVKDSIPLVRDHSEDIHQLQDMENSPGNIHCDLEVVHVQIKFSKVKVNVIGSQLSRLLATPCLYPKQLLKWLVHFLAWISYF